jgi:hypothetical protein
MTNVHARALVALTIVRDMMIKKIANLLKRRGVNQAEEEQTKVILPSVLNATSDGQPHMDKATFSVVIGDEELEWDIRPLHEMARRQELVRTTYEIPAKFLHEWYWGDSTVEEHTLRALHADINFPIIIWDGQIVDGAHRCCLSLAAGMNTIKALEIINMPPYDRAYPPKVQNRQPLNRKPPHEPLSHAHVVKAVRGHMFTPLPEFTTRHDDSPAVKAAIAQALIDAEEEHKRLKERFPVTKRGH